MGDAMVWFVSALQCCIHFFNYFHHPSSRFPFPRQNHGVRRPIVVDSVHFDNPKEKGGLGKLN